MPKVGGIGATTPEEARQIEKLRMMEDLTTTGREGLLNTGANEKSAAILKSIIKKAKKAVSEIPKSCI